MQNKKKLTDIYYNKMIHGIAEPSFNKFRISCRREFSLAKKQDINIDLNNVISINLHAASSVAYNIILMLNEEISRFTGKNFDIAIFRDDLFDLINNHLNKSDKLPS